MTTVAVIVLAILALVLAGFALALELVRRAGEVDEYDEEIEE